MTATDAGTYTVQWYFAGDSDHTDDADTETPNSIDVTIAPKSAAGLTITLDLSRFTADGSTNQTPTVTVADSETVLTEDTDYTVAITPEPQVEVGTYTVTVTGMGNYDPATTAAQTYTIDGGDKIGKYIKVVVTESEVDYPSMFAVGPVVKADSPAAPAGTISVTKTETEITVTAPVNAAYEYSCDGGETWQDEAAFTELGAGTDYQITVRVKETDTTYVGDAMTARSVTTNVSMTISDAPVQGAAGNLVLTPQPTGEITYKWYLGTSTTPDGEGAKVVPTAAGNTIRIEAYKGEDNQIGSVVSEQAVQAIQTLVENGGSVQLDGGATSDLHITADTTLTVEEGVVVTINGTITFDANGGSALDPITLGYGATATLSEAPLKTDYNFAGWNTAADGTGTPYADGASFTLTGDLTLYAQWTAKPLCTVSGTVTQSGGTAGGVTVRLVQGEKNVAVTQTDASGAYSFSAPEGTYNLVAELGGKTKTNLVTLDAAQTVDLALPTENVNSVLTVSGGATVQQQTVTLTDGEGVYSFTHIPEGQYSLNQEWSEGGKSNRLERPLLVQ